MIEAYDAKKRATQNWLVSLTEKEKTAHFYIEAKINEHVEKGLMSLYLDYNDMPDMFDLVVKQFATLKFEHYYNAMGYRVQVNTSHYTGGLRIAWT